MSKTDRLFETKDYGTGNFCFDEQVADVFDDMISRSVPLYAEVQKFAPRLIGLSNTVPLRILDLGCSTGTSLLEFSNALPHQPLELIGVDLSPDMLERCREKLSDRPAHHQLILHEAPLQEFEMDQYSLVLLNYTLQFLPVAERPALLRRVYHSLPQGGVLLLSEKLVHAEDSINQILQGTYVDYKKAKGYSDLEISRKRDALEDVLVPCTVEQNLSMLRSAGFDSAELLLKWFNFGTFLATRS